MKRTTILGFCFTALVALAVWAPNVLAFEYNGSCTNCHNWFNSSHENHKSRTSCITCHDGNRNGYTTASSCANANCHNAAPLQTRHIDNYGVASCEGCHPQSPPPACNDSDGDGYGNPGNSSCAIGSATDCNDNNASINPGAAENCTDGIDNNCDGLVDTQDKNAIGCPLGCTDNDGDTYSPDGGTCGQTDCNDSDASVNPGAYEACADGVDNNCNGQTDCNDSSCSGDPACLLDFCADYGTDRNRCKADPRCNYSGKNKACFEPLVYTQSECDAAGGRWNNKKETCTIR